MGRMNRQQIRAEAMEEVINLLRLLYANMHERLDLNGGSFAYGTLNGIALARLEIESKVKL